MGYQHMRLMPDFLVGQMPDPLFKGGSINLLQSTDHDHIFSPVELSEHF